MKELKLGLIVQAIDRATAPLRKISDGVKSFEERTEKLRGALKKIGLVNVLGGAAVVAGVGYAARGVWELTNRVATLGEEYLHSAKKAGLSVEATQRLRYAAKQLGVDEDALSQVFFRFQTHLANGVAGQKETLKALKLLGISAQEAGRLTKDPQEAFLRLVDGFSKIENPTLRAKLAMDLFSRSGYQLLPMLVAGRGEITKFMAQLDAAHAVMSTKDAEAAEAFIQKKREMGLALLGLQIQIGVGLMPAMTAFIAKMTEAIQKLRPDVANRLNDALKRMTDELPTLVDLLVRLLTITLNVVDGFLKFTDRVGGAKVMVAALAAIITANLLVGFISLVGQVAASVVAFGEFVGVITTMIELTAGVTTFAEAMVALDLAMDANPIGVIVLVITLLIAVIAAVAFGVYQLIKHWSGVTAFFKNLWDQVTSIFQNAWKKIGDSMPDWLKKILKVGAIGATFALNPMGGVVAEAASLAPPSWVNAGSPAAAPAKAKVDIHVSHDAPPKVRATAAAGVEVNVHRGVAPG